ncbi:Glucosidase II subunit alpha [Entamoeba marina]
MFVLTLLILNTLAFPNKPPTCNSRTWCALNRDRIANHYSISPKSYTTNGNVLEFKAKPLSPLKPPLQLKIMSSAPNIFSIRFTYPSEHHRQQVFPDISFASYTPQEMTHVSSTIESATFTSGNSTIVIHKNASIVIDSTTCINCDGLLFYSEDTSSSYFPVGVDVTLPTTQLFGSGKNVQRPLPSTYGDNAGFEEPYHFYASDYTTFPVNSTNPQYGTLPIFIAPQPTSTVAALYVNPTDTFVDLKVVNEQSKLIFTSEDGDVELVIISKPTPAEVISSYYEASGHCELLPRFAFGFQQSKWGYNSQTVVESVDKLSDENGIMYDVLWLDIETTHRKQYFTWASATFPDPVALQNELKSKNRYIVTIQDCHIATEDDYFVHEEGVDNDYFIKNEDGDDYLGVCWPARANWVDFTNEEARKWWGGLYSFDNYVNTTDILYAWNDMNEPSEFDVEDLLVKKSAVHYNNVLHHNVHSMYGLLQQLSTHDGLLKRSNGVLRPFVLSRSYYFGSQKYGAIWTGDSDATWAYLSSQVAQITDLSLLGLFVGGDIGGFASDPTTELLVRWYQAAVFQPFFRSHASQTADRREPWLFDDSTFNRIKDVITLRYTMLPYWYTSLYKHTVNSVPLLRPLYYQFPSDVDGYNIENQFMIGDAFMAAPIVTEGATTHTIYFPNDIWYDVFSPNTIITGPITQTIDVTLDSIPLYARAGVIVPQRIISEGKHSGSESERTDYLQIVIYDNNGKAEGLFYTDDGISVDNSEYHVKADLHFIDYIFNFDVEGSYLYGDYVKEVVLVTKEVIKKVTLVSEVTEKELTFTQEEGKVVVKRVLNHLSQSWGNWSLRFEL